MVKSPTLPPASSMAILMPLTIVCDWALALPVRGRLETILMSGESTDPPPAPPQGGSAKNDTQSTATQSERNNRFMQGFWHKRQTQAIRKGTGRPNTQPDGASQKRLYNQPGCGALG